MIFYIWGEAVVHSSKDPNKLLISLAAGYQSSSGRAIPWKSMWLDRKDIEEWVFLDWGVPKSRYWWDKCVSWNRYHQTIDNRHTDRHYTTNKKRTTTLERLHCWCARSKHFITPIVSLTPLSVSICLIHLHNSRYRVIRYRNEWYIWFAFVKLDCIANANANANLHEYRAQD